MKKRIQNNQMVTFYRKKKKRKRKHDNNKNIIKQDTKATVKVKIVKKLCA